MEQAAILWDNPHYILGDQPFVPVIFDGRGEAPEGFNTLKIKLDGRLQADLDWKLEREKARRALEKGYFLFWEMDLGLFSHLSYPLVNQTQFLSLGIAMDHFRNEIWKEFSSKSIGLSIYRGPADFSLHFPWDETQITNLRDWLATTFQNLERFNKETGLTFSSFEEITPTMLFPFVEGKKLLSLFCRDVGLEYLHLLSHRLSDAIPCILLLDAGSLASSPIWQLQLLHPEPFDPLVYAIKNGGLPFESLGWDGPPSNFGYLGTTLPSVSPSKAEVSIGFCLPPGDKICPSHYHPFEKAMLSLLHRDIPFKLIPESQLTTQWDGLDHLLYAPSALSREGTRKLQGFCAAGGTAVTLEHKTGLSHEIDLTNFMEKI